MKVSEYQDIGQYIRDSRESLHITTEQAAKALNIRTKYLKAIESGDLGELPGKAYTRGYIRNYVEYLRLNSQEVLDAYEALLVHKDHEFFIPEPNLVRNLPSKGILKWSLIGLLALYGFWYIALHDSTTLNVRIPDVPQSFMQLLDKNRGTAMDKRWSDCLEQANADCFIALHTEATIPHNKILYDIDFNNTAPQEP